MEKTCYNVSRDGRKSVKFSFFKEMERYERIFWKIASLFGLGRVAFANAATAFGGAREKARKCRGKMLSVA